MKSNARTCLQFSPNSPFPSARQKLLQLLCDSENSSSSDETLSHLGMLEPQLDRATLSLS